MGNENKDDLPELDMDDDEGVFGLPDGDEDDLTKTLRENMKDASDDEDEDDDGGFNAPLDDDDIESNPKVDEDEGFKKIQEAKSKKTAAKPRAKKGKAAAAADDAADDAATTAAAAAAGKPEKDETADATVEDGAAKTSDAATISDDDYNKSIAELPEAVRTRIETATARYDEITAPITGRIEEFKALGMGETAGDVVKSLTNIQDYAAREPSNYAAWFVGQMAGGDAGKAEKILTDAAKTLGYKVEKDAGDQAEDDPFMSDRERELIEENRALKAAQQPSGPAVGPNSPQEQVRNVISSAINERDATGQLVRPHFEKLSPLITQLVKEAVATEGRPVDAKMMNDAYLRAELAHPATADDAMARELQRRSAATAADTVQQETGKQKAAAQQSVDASTKILDGPGQSANRQPAAAKADVGLEDFIRSVMPK